MAAVIKNWSAYGGHSQGYFVVAQSEAGIADLFELSDRVPLWIERRGQSRSSGP